jgi:predicted nucleic acid-binding protein
LTQRVYLDTSVISALHDGRKPERQAQTQSFWGTRVRFEMRTSDLARVEIERTLDAAHREAMLRSLDEIESFALTDEMRELAARYMGAGIFSPAQLDDALHAAAASISRSDVLASWNFRHLVNRRRRAAVNALNVSLGFPRVDIISPPEL